MAGGLVVQSGLGAIFRLISVNTVNNTLVKAGQTVLYGGYVSNTNAAARWLKLFNKATTPVAGTDTPYATICVPGTTLGGVASFTFTGGLNFPLGLGFALTTGVADNDTNAVAASEVVVNLDVGASS